MSAANSFLSYKVNADIEIYDSIRLCEEGRHVDTTVFVKVCVW